LGWNKLSYFFNTVVDDTFLPVAVFKDGVIISALLAVDHKNTATSMTESFCSS
jgi:hypothetical protein